LRIGVVKEVVGWCGRNIRRWSWRKLFNHRGSTMLGAGSEDVIVVIVVIVSDDPFLFNVATLPVDVELLDFL